MASSKKGRRRTPALKIDIGERRLQERRDDSVRQRLSLVYENIYIPAFNNYLKPRNKRASLHDLTASEYEEKSAETFAVMLAGLDANFGKLKTIREFAIEMANRSLLEDELGNSILPNDVKKIKWA